ncbi:hypothetical protein RSK20926_19147 [Roseobacter sp. SK209-2-6]|uniref:hypothetical protein n=1 Tax=Roseobacter sp. SK209-2-6 TaxID=388739 RepID=UPI0000F3F5F2|nr:hypothetical protein [Roseobacter sp. SK209-2-6]EBA17886.1 hypothetical protein RSK20926_19147 [Roseobacter sp. SK209-2-6]
MTSLGYTADQDNARLDPSLVQAAVDLMARELPWEVAGPKDQVLMRSFEELKGRADRVAVKTQTGGGSAWVMQNDWSGFPDPAEYVLVGFCHQGEINALGYFEDWPPA